MRTIAVAALGLLLTATSAYAHSREKSRLPGLYRTTISASGPFWHIHCFEGGRQIMSDRVWVVREFHGTSLLTSVFTDRNGRLVNITPSRELTCILRQGSRGTSL